MQQDQLDLAARGGSAGDSSPLPVGAGRELTDRVLKCVCGSREVVREADGGGAAERTYLGRALDTWRYLR